MNYAEVRPRLDTGDAVLFVRLTLRQALTQGWRGIGGYLSNLAITIAQWRAGESFDGLHEAVHVGAVIRNEEQDEVLLCEYTAGQRGAGLHRLSERIMGYPGRIIVVPLDSKRKARVRSDIAAAWLAEHRDTAYRYAGLIWPCAKHMRGWEWRGAMFCSEAVVSLYQKLGVVPHSRPVLRRGQVVQQQIMPHWYAPAEVGRLPQLDWSEAITFGGEE